MVEAMAQPPLKKSRTKSRSATAGARPGAKKEPTTEEIATIRNVCTRFLAGDGKRDATSLLASIPLDTQIDRYGTGGVVTEIESEMAALLGKDAALFLVTGIMAQQATLRIHCDDRNRHGVVFHPTCHLDTHEERAYERLHGLSGILCGPSSKPLTLENLTKVAEPFGALLLELPQRSLGGTLPTWEELVSMTKWARERGGAVHMDGARLWEAGPFYATTANKSLADIAALFDTVYVSFYKGLGAIAGCCVAGDQRVINELNVWRTRHGGQVFGLWPYAASAKAMFALRSERFAGYFVRAQKIAQALRRVEGVEVLPYPVQSSMMHLRVSGPRQKVMDRMLDIARHDGVWMFAGPYVTEGPNLQRFEFNVGDATMAFSVEEIRELFERVLGHSKN